MKLGEVMKTCEEHELVTDPRKRAKGPITPEMGRDHTATKHAPHILLAEHVRLTRQLHNKGPIRQIQQETCYARQLELLARTSHDKTTYVQDFQQKGSQLLEAELKVEFPHNLPDLEVQIQDYADGQNPQQQWR